MNSINWSLHIKSFGRHVKNKKIPSVILDIGVRNSTQF
jgi:hypothetical protein